jgi:methylenetetrahydrofolate reductase (NADPH)
VTSNGSRQADGPAIPGAPARGRLQRRLEAGEFAVTAEISPPRGADVAPVTRAAALLRDWVDAANITDNQSSHVRLSSFAGSLAALGAGVEPVMQATARDRNRIALQSDLLSAGAMGIPNVLLMTGDHPRHGDHADAKPVFDLDSVQLLWVARHMRDQGLLLSGRRLDPPPSWFIGAVENPFSRAPGSTVARLGRKVTAGAQFVQTQFVFDVDAFARWMSEVRDLGLHERCHILAGVGPIRSLRTLDLLLHRLAGVHVGEDVERRLRGVPPDAVAGEGVRLAAELIQRIRELPGVAGVHVMAFGHEEVIPDVLDRSGIGRRALLGGAGARPGGGGRRHAG